MGLILITYEEVGLCVSPWVYKWMTPK